MIWYDLLEESQCQEQQFDSVVLGATNAIAESVNSKIKNIKRWLRGFRDGDRAKDAIFFHLGGLNMKHSQGLSSLAMFV